MTATTYTFVESIPANPGQAIRERKVRQAMGRWESLANVSFSHVEDIDSARIHIAFEATTAKMYGSRPGAIILKEINGDSDFLSREEEAAIIREMGFILVSLTGQYHKLTPPGTKLHDIMELYKSNSPSATPEVYSQADIGCPQIFQKTQRTAPPEVIARNPRMLNLI